MFYTFSTFYSVSHSHFLRLLLYSVFHRFSQGKFDNIVFDSKLEPIFTTAPAALINEARGQNRLKINGSLTNNLNSWNSLFYFLAGNEKNRGVNFYYIVITVEKMVQFWIISYLMKDFLYKMLKREFYSRISNC